ncbi:hypothetical protein SAMN05421504_106427 [Amycolatopsis xylanica]|uniref:Pentapeptide repeat-containing protein n=1 Tax=Amycolatopsis xylanica TaxID=589385 RepID=A0A1H3LZQ0_9PSEU|nr:pentapeptide repeat-containing protein [Amycolatopsis xylanica]SDY69796.1 hypothetical protein SAMN05421504_106427 [Amycolatopsis xylanica]
MAERQPPLLRWPWIAAAAGLVALLTAGLVWFLLGWTDSPDPEKVKAKLDAVRTAFSIGIGAGGVFALWLAARRQRTTELQVRETARIAAETKAHAERVAEVTERDLEERRVTELYTKAVEQLGSDKAPVRLGGLYALERLGQANPSHRQTIMNVFCAYLRMPFTMSGEAKTETAARRALRDREPSPRAWGLRPPAERAEVVVEDELQVRMTAQQLIENHLHADSPVFWADMRLDLQRATLVNFTLQECTLRAGQFSYARFVGATHIARTTFEISAWFYGCEFTALADFSGSDFAEGGVFSWTHFAWLAHFSGSKSRGLGFIGAVFDGELRFADVDHPRINFERSRMPKLPDFGAQPVNLDGALVSEEPATLPADNHVESRDGEIVFGYTGEPARYGTPAP